MDRFLSFLLAISIFGHLQATAQVLKPGSVPPPPPKLNPPADPTPKIVAPPVFEVTRPTATVAPATRPQPVVVSPMPVAEPAAAPTGEWQPRLLQRGTGVILLAEGATLPVRPYQNMLIPTQDELPVVLEVAEDVIGADGKVAVPKGSRVEATVAPVFREKQERMRSSYKVVTKKIYERSTLVTRTLTVRGQTYALDALNPNLAFKADPRAVGDDASLKGASYGFGAGVALGIVTGGLGLPLLLAGSSMGALTGAVPAEVIELDPKQPLTLTLRSPLRGSLQVSSIQP